MKSIAERIAEELNVRLPQVTAAVALPQDGRSGTLWLGPSSDPAELTAVG